MPSARRRIADASVTPLSSIFGSGFLIIVPVLERTVGVLAVPAIAGVCALAWVLGTAVRHNVAVAESTSPSRRRRLRWGGAGAGVRHPAGHQRRGGDPGLRGLDWPTRSPPTATCAGCCRGCCAIRALSPRNLPRLGFAALAVLMVAVTVLAVPAS